MTNSQEMLVEEYKKLIHSIEINTVRLRKCPKGVAMRTLLKNRIKRDKKDLRWIRRSLGPVMIYQLRKELKLSGNKG